MMVCGPSQAETFRLENGLEGGIDSIVSFGLAMRTSSSNCAFIGRDNGGCASTSQVPIAMNNPANFSQTYDASQLNADNGNLNTGKGQVYSAQLKGVHDLYASQGQWSGFMRLSWFQDFAVNRTKRTALEPAAKSYATSEVRLLDAYVDRQFEIASRSARVRFGNQVLSWGEDIFIPGGVNSTNAIDLRKAHQPGIQLKEIMKPAPMISFSSSLANGIGFEAYYQWRWNAFDFDAPGTFFSTSDFLGRGGNALYLPSSAFGAATGSVGDNGTINSVTGTRLAMAQLANPAINPLGFGTVLPASGNLSARNSGQFGFAFRGRDSESENEWGLYYLRYHDKIPFVNYRVNQATTSNPVGLGSFFFDYAQDRDLFGISYNFKAGDWAMGLEGSYRPRDTVSIDPSIVINPANPYYCNGDGNPANFRPTGYVCKGMVETKKYQFHLTGIHIMSPSGSLGWLMRSLGASEGMIMAEAAVAHYPELKLGAGIPYAITVDYAVPTKTSSGFVLSTSLNYPAILGTRVALLPDLTFFQGVSGISPTPLPGFIGGAGAMTLGFTFDFKTKPSTRARVDYTRNYGGGLSNNLRDRDFMTMSLSTSF